MQGDREVLRKVLPLARDAMAAGHLTEAITAVMAVVPHRQAATAAQLVDLLERACVYGPRMLVDFVWDELEPFAYRGWALALALRCAREDVARDLLDKGVRLMEDPPMAEGYRTIAAHERSLSRFDLTQGSAGLFAEARQRTVCTEVFAPFRGEEQLVGGTFATSTNLASTCDVVGRLAGEGLFDDVEFDDLLRAALLRAAQLGHAPDPSQPEAQDACLALARRLLRLHERRGLGGGYLGLVLGNFLHDRTDESILTFLCREAPQAVHEALESFSWMADDGELLRRLVAHLSPGTPRQNAHLLRLLARFGYLPQMRAVAKWPGASDAQALDQALEAASGAGHAQAASWLLGRRRSLAPAVAPAAQGSDDIAKLLL